VTSRVIQGKKKILN